MMHNTDLNIKYQNRPIMAKVKPFRGIRPPKEFIEQVASRPYDVLNSDEARIEAQGNPKSLYHIIKPEIDFEPWKGAHNTVSSSRPMYTTM